jgi:hypothetical protein
MGQFFEVLGGRLPAPDSLKAFLTIAKKNLDAL